MRINEVSALRTYATLTTVSLCLLLSEFRQGAQPAPRFEEITIERINVVESDGSLRVVISNRERFPDPDVNGIPGQRSSSHPGFPAEARSDRRAHV